VGDVERVDIDVLSHVMEKFVPVIASIGVDECGASYNVNADLVAGAVAAALGASKLVYVTDVPGLYDREGTLVSRATVSECEELLADGAATGGMIPKLTSAISAMRAGVRWSHLIRRRGRTRADPRAVHPRGVRHDADPGRGGRARMTGSAIMPTYTRYPVTLVRGKGMRVWDADGRSYLDFAAGIAVLPLGHAPDFHRLLAGSMSVFMQLFVIAFQIAAPVVITLLLVDSVLGIVARVVPQMNVFFVGIPLKVGIGMAAIIISLPTVLNVFQGQPQRRDHECTNIFGEGLAN